MWEQYWNRITFQWYRKWIKHIYYKCASKFVLTFLYIYKKWEAGILFVKLHDKSCQGIYDYMQNLTKL